MIVIAGTLRIKPDDLDKFIDNKDITIEKEYPLTDNNKNKYVRFRPITNA